MSNYKTSVRLSLFVVVAVLAGTVLGILLERAALRNAYETVRQGDKLSWALSEIERRYVDPITRDSLAELAVPVLLQELDPHSVYIPASEFAATNEPLAGTFDGIGVMFNMLTDTVQITNVISGGPSASAGIVAGDRIITVNDSVIAGVKMNQDKVVGLLRGPRGTTVRLGILREPATELLPITVTRGAIPVKSLEAAFLVPGEPEIGYVRFGRFAATTYNEVMAALADLREQGARKVIVDLRGNGGGYLDQAIFIANEFLGEGRKIVYTEGAASPRADQHADGRGRFQDLELAVVIDENSASASEIVAGAMQDWDRATIVGRRTFGKGLVQQQVPLNDGSAVRLTVAHYYTPSGRSIQRPYRQGDLTGYYSDMAERYNSGELTGGAGPAVDSTQRYRTLVKGRTVYGGGGITPDVPVPLDTTYYSDYWSGLVRHGVLLEFAVTELDRHRTEYREKYPDFETFARDFALTPEMNERLVSLAALRGVPYDEAGMERSRSLIATQIKALIAQRLWDTTAYYRVIHAENDPDFAAAVAIATAKN